MARIPAHIVDEIMNTARIEEVIGEFVQLKKAGSNYKGLSPFTEEKTPSFMVSPAKQIFKCFSTGKGGTVVSFLMEIEQFSYPEALKWLADRYNIQLPEEKPMTPEEQLELSERESLQIVNTYARDFFVDTLHNSEEGKSVGLSYFKERDFTLATIEKFQLGYCPLEAKSLTETAIENGHKQRYLEQLGLTKVKGDRRFDFFSGRVIFPIHSVSGKVLGFGGRVLRTDQKTAKYFNSPESILYDKSRTLYGIFFAKNEIIKQDNCLLVEGYTDVISLSQAGVENVVSSSGTSLTPGQIKLIQRYTQNITVLYDSDNAGIKASFRGIDMLLEAGMNVKVLLFPEGEDPDSFAKSVSSEELKAFITEQQQDFVSFKTDILLKDAEEDPILKAKMIKEIINSIALIPDNIIRSVYIQDIATRFDFEEQTLFNELNRTRRNQANKPVSLLEKKEETPEPNLLKEKQNLPEERNFYAQEMDLIRLLVLYGSRAIEFKGTTGETQEGQEGKIEISVAEVIIHEIVRDEIQFQEPKFQEIYSICREGLEQNTFYEASHFLRHENADIVRFVTDIMSTRYELSNKWLSEYNIVTTEEVHILPQAVKEALYTFKSSVIIRKINALQERLKTCSEEEMNEILTEQIYLEKVRSQFAEQLKRIII